MAESSDVSHASVKCSNSRLDESPRAPDRALELPSRGSAVPAATAAEQHEPRRASVLALQEEGESDSLLSGSPRSDEGRSGQDNVQGPWAAGSALSSAWSKVGTGHFMVSAKQEQVWQLLQSMFNGMYGMLKVQSPRGSKAGRRKQKVSDLDEDDTEDGELKGTEEDSWDLPEMLTRLRRALEKMLIALGCLCLVLVLAFAIVGLVSVLLWFSSGSTAPYAPSETRSSFYGASDTTLGADSHGAADLKPQEPATLQDKHSADQGSGREGPSSASPQSNAGGSTNSWAQWMDWWHLSGHTCKNEQIPIPAVGDMREGEKIGQMVAVAVEDMERQRGVARTVGSDLIGAVYARSGDHPLAGNDLRHWSQLVQKVQAAAQRTRLRIPPLVGAEMMHGLANIPGTTVFPHAIALGATHNITLAQLAGYTEAKEAASVGIRWALGPTLSVCRNPRWGRCLECVGENERLVRMLNSRLDGLTGAASGPGWSLLEQNMALLLPTARFFMAEAGSMNGRSGPESNLEMPEDAQLRSMHLRPFFDANVRGVQMMMLGEGRVNGQPIHNNTYLIDILKKQLRYAGVLVSSFNGLSSIPAKSLQVQVETIVNAGVDLILAPPGQHVAVLRALKRGLRSGAIRIERVNDAVRRLLRAKELSAHFDYPCAPHMSGSEKAGEEEKETPIPPAGNEAHRELARRLVRQSLVLLKNGGQGKDIVFPLPAVNGQSRNGRPAQGITLYVGGSHADDIGRQCGGYTLTSQGSAGPITRGSTIIDGFRELLQPPSTVIQLGEGGRVHLERGRSAFPPNTYAVLAVGEEPYSGADGDASAASLRLSKESEELVEDTCSKVVCIVVLVTGRPVDIKNVVQHANAIVAAWLPGTEAGGIADVFLNENLDFQGTLPITWFRNATAQLPINFGDPIYSPLFPYGYGLTKSGLLLNGTYVSRG